MLKPLPNQKVEGRLWRSQLGHAEINAIRQLPKKLTRAVIKGPITVKNKPYAVNKAYKAILKRTPISKIANQGIAVKSLALNTLEQNSSAERSGGVSMLEDEDKTQVNIGGS